MPVEWAEAWDARNCPARCNHKQRRRANGQTAQTKHRGADGTAACARARETRRKSGGQTQHAKHTLLRGRQHNNKRAMTVCGKGGGTFPSAVLEAGVSDDPRVKRCLIPLLTCTTGFNTHYGQHSPQAFTSSPVTDAGAASSAVRETPAILVATAGGARSVSDATGSSMDATARSVTPRCVGVGSGTRASVVTTSLPEALADGLTSTARSCPCPCSSCKRNTERVSVNSSAQHIDRGKFLGRVNPSLPCPFSSLPSAKSHAKRHTHLRRSGGDGGGCQAGVRGGVGGGGGDNGRGLGGRVR